MCEVGPQPSINDARITTIKELFKIQALDGNWNFNSYMLGMFNGMELIIATLEARDPKFRSLGGD